MHSDAGVIPETRAGPKRRIFGIDFEGKVSVDMQKSNAGRVRGMVKQTRVGIPCKNIEILLRYSIR